MKKVNNINFSGRLISIEEDAYQALQNYLDSLKNYFSKEEGKEEIIEDIENRIAEIFYDKQTKGKTSITIEDVEEVIRLIGKPEDFEPKEEEPTANYSKESYTEKQYVGRGRLYRNKSDKMLGGVCSGIAAYFNIDTVLVRIIFAVLLFGAGVGFLLYIVLWIFVPESNTVNTSLEKRLYRNSEDRIFGGVSSGLASYFGIDVWIPRLIFAAPFILSVIKGFSAIAYHEFFHSDRFWSFSFGGTTTVVYFLLWWIIPEAKTVQEKMAMKGEKMDLNSIKNNIQDDLKNFGNKANAWGKEFTQKSNEWSSSVSDKTRDNTQKINTVARTTGNKIGHGIGLAFKGFALFIGGTIAFALLMSLIALLISGFNIWPLKAYLFENGWQTAFFWGTLLLLLTPGLAFIVWLVRRIMKTNKYAKQIRATFGILFFVGIVSVIFLTASITNNFKSHNDTYPPTELSITQPKNCLLVKASEPEVLYSGEIPWVEINEVGFDINQDSLKYANIKVRIDRSADTAYHIKLKKYSRGKTYKDAESRAQKLSYNWTQQDSVLDLGSHITVSKNEKFRAQQVIVIIEIPVGKKIKFDQTLNEKFNPFNVRVSEKWVNGRRVYRNSGIVFDYENHFDYQPNLLYTMQEDGRLTSNTNTKQQLENNTNDDDIEQQKKDLQQEKKDRELQQQIDQKNRELERKKIEAEKIEREKEELERKRTNTVAVLDSNIYSITTPFAFIPPII